MRLKDKLAIGIVAGLLGPLTAMFIFYKINFGTESFDTFLTESVTKGLMSPLLSLCTIINLGLFFLFLQTERLYSARGVILSTIVIGGIIVVLKFVL